MTKFKMKSITGAILMFEVSALLVQAEAAYTYQLIPLNNIQPPPGFTQVLPELAINDHDEMPVNLHSNCDQNNNCINSVATYNINANSFKILEMDININALKYMPIHYGLSPIANPLINNNGTVGGFSGSDARPALFTTTGKKVIPWPGIKGSVVALNDNDHAVLYDLFDVIFTEDKIYNKFGCYQNGVIKLIQTPYSTRYAALNSSEIMVFDHGENYFSLYDCVTEKYKTVYTGSSFSGYDINANGNVLGPNFQQMGIWTPQDHFIPYFDIPAGWWVSKGALNNNNEIVATVYNSNNFSSYLLPEPGVAVDLKTLISPAIAANVVSIEAKDINNNGDILGSAKDINGNNVPFLLKRTMPSKNLIPQNDTYNNVSNHFHNQLAFDIPAAKGVRANDTPSGWPAGLAFEVIDQIHHIDGGKATADLYFRDTGGFYVVLHTTATTMAERMADKRGKYQFTYRMVMNSEYSAPTTVTLNVY